MLILDHFLNLIITLLQLLRLTLRCKLLLIIVGESLFTFGRRLTIFHQISIKLYWSILIIAINVEKSIVNNPYELINISSRFIHFHKYSLYSYPCQALHELCIWICNQDLFFLIKRWINPKIACNHSTIFYSPICLPKSD